MKRKITFLSIICLLGIFFMSGMLYAQSNPEYVEELFDDYPNGDYDTTTVKDLDGGEGWSGSWYEMYDDPEMVLTITDGVAHLVGNLARNLETPISDNGETIWFYLKLNSDEVSEENYAGVSLFTFADVEDFYIGQEWNETVMSARGGGYANARARTGIEANIEQELLVQLITDGTEDGEERLNLWVNPTGTDVADTVGSITFVMPDIYTYLSFRTGTGVTCDFMKFGKNLNKVFPTTSLNSIKALEFGLTNYPNPYIEYTNISFILPYASHGKLEIFDITGKVVKVFNEKLYAAGKNELKVTTDFAEGVYYYKLSIGNKSAVNKMVVIK